MALISGAVGDREALDAVDPAGAEVDRVTGFGDVRHGVGDGVEDEFDLRLGEAGARALVRAQDASLGRMPTCLVICQPM
jgi:hypothetical protein